MRRAMSCATWDPKSRMRIRSTAGDEGRGTRGEKGSLPECISCPLPLAPCPSLNVVIRRLLGDLDVVDVGFAHARGGDLHEFGAGAHVVDRAVAGVAHARAQ